MIAGEFVNPERSLEPELLTWDRLTIAMFNRLSLVAPVVLMCGILLVTWCDSCSVPLLREIRRHTPLWILWGSSLSRAWKRLTLLLGEVSMTRPTAPLWLLWLARRILINFLTARKVFTERVKTLRSLVPARTRCGDGDVALVEAGYGPNWN